MERREKVNDCSTARGCINNDVLCRGHKRCDICYSGCCAQAEFVLEQMRLLLDNNDLIRANMVSVLAVLSGHLRSSQVAKKLSKKLLDDKDFEDIKIAYNKHMVNIDFHVAEQPGTPSYTLHT